MIKNILGKISKFLTSYYDDGRDIIKTDEEKEKENLSGYGLAAFFGVLVFAIYYRYAQSVMWQDTLSDLKEHTATAANIYLDASFFDRWLERPYMLWFLCVKGMLKFTNIFYEDAAAFVCAFFGLACFVAVFWMLNRLNKFYFGIKAKSFIPAVLAATLSFVQPLYVAWFNADQYLGQFSVNPIFNAPHMAVKCFGIFAVAVSIDIIRRNYGYKPVFFSEKVKEFWMYFILAVALFMAVFTKPTFVFMFIPAGLVYVAILLIIFLCKKDKENLKKTGSFTWKMTLACIPAGVYIIIEYVAFYFWGTSNGDSHIAVSSLFNAWKSYSPNVFISIILGMAFPIWMVVTDFKYFWQSIEGRLSLVCYFTGMFEFALFIETGYKFGHLNFAWEYMSGMLVIFVIAAWRLMMQTLEYKGGFLAKARVCVGWFLLFMQLYSGFYMLNNTNLTYLL